MKLHLPKRLLTALLATFSVVTSFSTTAWAGSWNEEVSEEYNFTGTDDATELNTADHVGTNGTFVKAKAPNLNITLTKITQVDGQKLTITGTWNDATNSFNVLTVDELVIGDGTGVGALTIADDFGATLTTQKINIKKVSGTINKLIVDTHGVLQLGTAGGTNTFTISSGTIESGGKLDLAGGTYNITGLSNSGTVVLQLGSEDIVLNNVVGEDNGTYKPSVIANTATGNIVIDNTGNKTLNGGITISNGGKVTLKGGSFGTESAKIANTIKTANSTTLAFEDIDVFIGGNDNTNQMLDANIEVGNGATMTISYNDRYHYTNAHTLKVLSGGTVELGTTRQTLAQGFIVELAGGSIRGTGDSAYNIALDFYNGGTVKVTENSSLDAHVGGHDGDASVEFNVASGKTLTMNSNLVTTGVVKSEAGDMIYKGAAFNKSLTISGGVFEYNIADAAEERTHSAGISGVGTLRKSGAGTLTLSSANTFVDNLAVTEGKLVYDVTEERTHTLSGNGGTFEKTGAGTLNLDALTNVSGINLTVTAGKLVYNVAEGEKTHTLSGTGGTFEKTGAGTLELGALKDYAYTGGLTVSEGKVVFAGTEGTADSDEDANNPPGFVKLVNGLTTVGDAKVEIVGNVLFNHKGVRESQSVINIDDNITITGDLRVNSYESANAPDGDGMRRWNVLTGANLNVGKLLWLTNDQKMVVSGGNVMAAGGIKLGHDQNDNDGAHHSKLVLESGSVTTTGVTFNKGENDVVMTGGELTFTPGTDGDGVLTGGSGTNRFTVSGGTLKATDTSWALTGTPLTGTNVHAVSLGNATFDIAANKTVTLSGDIALTGALTVTGDGKLMLGETKFATSIASLGSLSYEVDSEVESTQNGIGSVSYQAISGKFEQVENTSVSVAVDGANATYSWNNGSIVAKDSAFIINTTFAANQIVDDASTEYATVDNGAIGADVFVVNQTGKFTVNGDITGGKTASELVACTLGTGTMVLATDATVSDVGRVNFAGNLEIATGGTLTLGKTGNHLTEYPSNLSSLNALNLNGGTLKMYYVAPLIKSMTVETASTIYIDDVWSNKQTAKADATLIDSLQLDANLALDVNWKANVNIGTLTGNGNLTVSQESTDVNDSTRLWIDAVNNYTGEISLSDNVHLTLNSGETETTQAVRLSVDAYTGNISLGGNLAASLNIGEDKSLNASQLSVGSGSTATLTGSGEYNLGATTSLGSGVSLSDSWTGTVSITGAASDGADLATLGNASSKIAINGLNGWIQRKNIESLIELGANGMTLTAYSTSGTYDFAGGVSGTGNIVLDSSSDASPHFNIGSNGTSGWEGGFVVKNMAAGTTVELKMIGGGELMADDSKGIQMNSNTGTLSFVIGNSDVVTTMNGAVSNTGTGTLNMTVQGDTEFKAGVNVSQLSMNGTGVDVTLSGADNTIGGDLSIAQGNGLTLAEGSKLTVNSPIQNGGNLDIKGTVHWNLTSASGLTTAFDPGELTDRTTNGLGKGLVNGLVTGSGTLVDNGIIGATYNGAQAQYNTATGQAIIDNAIYYVVAPKNDTESSDNRYYVLDSDKNVYLRDVINVGNHKFDTTDGPIPDTEANQALGYYVAKGGTLCVSGDSSDSGLTAGQILQNTYGDGDVILRNPGYEHSTGHIPLEAIVTGEIKSTGNLYLNPFVLTEGVITYATVNHLTYVTLTLKDNADISSFNSINFGYQGTRIRVEGAIGADEDGHHLNNVSTLGSSDVEIFLLTDANEELVLGGTTTVQSHVYYPEESGHTGSHLNLCLNHDSAIRIEHLSDGGDPDAKEKATLVISSKGSEVNPIKDNVVAEVNIDSFDFRGGIQIDGSQLESQANGFITVNITLQENQWIEDIQCRSKYYQWAEQEVYLNFKGVGTYVLSDGSDIFVNPQSTNTIYLNFGKLSEEVDNQGNHIWQGTVQVNRLDGVSNGRGIDFRFFGNEQSTVDFRGFVGPVVSWNDEGAVNTALPDSVIIEPKLILTNVEAEGDDKQAMNAYEVTGGIKEQNYTGDISGDGDFVVSAADGMTFNLQGDVSEWKNGAELKVTNGTHNVNFSNAATEINADVLATGGTMNTTISNAAAVTVKGKVAADGGTLNLSVNTAQDTTFTNNVEVTKLAVGSGSTAKLQATSSAGNIQIDSYGKDKVATLSNGLTMEGNVVSSGHIADAMITQLQKQGSVELQDVTASNLYLYGNGVKFHSTDTKKQFTFDKQISYGNESVNEVVFTSDIFSGMILSKDGAQLTLTVNNAVVWGNAEQPDWTNVTIKLNGFTIEQLADSAGDWYWDKFGLSIEAVGAETTMLAADGLSTDVTALLNPNDYQFVEYVQDAYGLTIRMYNTPEPTTATLSMLALAALASRRRRRK